MRVTRAVLLAALAMRLAFAQNTALDSGIGEFGKGRYSEALRDLQTAVRENPNDAKAQVFFALTRAALGDCVGARPALMKGVAENVAPLDRMAGLAAAKCDSVAGRGTEASLMLDRLKKKYPDDADVLYLAAKIHMKAFNDATLAMFQRAPSSFRVHELSAEIFEVQSRFPDAVAEYKKAIELNPTAPDLHYRLGRALLLQGHSPELTSEAAEQFRAELALSPEDSASEFQLGQIAESAGQEADARKHFERAVNLSPDFVQALISLARILSRENQAVHSIELLERAVRLQPDNEAAHYGLLSAYRAAGKVEEAKQQKAVLDRLQRPPSGEFSDFLRKLGEKQPNQ